MHIDPHRISLTDLEVENVLDDYDIKPGKTIRTDTARRVFENVLKQIDDEIDNEPVTGI